MLVKTTPLIIQVYKQIYNNIIKNQDKLIERTQQLIEADKVIRTTYIDEEKEYDEKIKKRLKRQRMKIERAING